MPKKLDKLLVVDVESTCWEKEPPPGMISEIIEIGITVVNIQSLELEKSQSIIIKPTMSEVSEFCTNLTTITQTDVNKGITYEQACKILRKEFDSKNRPWASYGDYDRYMFENMSKLCLVQYPFGSRHLNIKTLFAMAYGLNKEVGMTKALSILNIKLKGTHHRGVDDSYNIALIFTDMIKKI